MIATIVQLWNLVKAEVGARPVEYGMLLTGVVILAVVAVLWRQWRRRSAATVVSDLDERLAAYPPAPPMPSGQQWLHVHGLPVRVRLVVVAPLGTDALRPQTWDVTELLNAVIPGLGHLPGLDQPRIRIWPTQLSQAGFMAAFRRHTLLPEPEARLSPWLLVMGRVLWRDRPYMVGLACRSAQPQTLGRVVVEQPHLWMGVLRLAVPTS